MSDAANPGRRSGALTDDAHDAAALARYATALADGVQAALGPWVERSVRSILEQHRPGSAAAVAEAARRAGEAAAVEVGESVRRLLATTVDAQRTGPLAVLRSAVRYPTEVLADAGVPAVERDPFAERAFPADVYDLAPAAFADLDPSLAEAGLVWGAAKAHVVLARRRAEGLR
ncbi:hypothetical protein BH10ACT1_BH10ACT1_35750 [soil metagenome]